jgi:chromosome segregation ATPase
MVIALEIAFAVGLAVVGISLVAVLTERAGERFLLWATVALGLAAVTAAVALGINLVSSFTETDALVLAAGGLFAAAVAEAGLLALSRGLGRIRQIEELADAARAEVSSHAAEEAKSRILELERMLARERANAGHQLSEQERRLAEERRDAVERQAERARVELTQSVASVQERLEQRLMAWAADLDRGQRELEQRLAELGQRQREAMSAYEARLAADAERVDAASEEQRLALTKLREELQRFGASFLEEGQSDIEIHAAERRRALHEVSERLRARERALREQLERDETEARTRIAAGLEESERRHLAALDRAFDRAATRLTEYAEKQFDAQIKQSREKSAERLSRELEKAIEQFARQAEKDVSDRIADMARLTADRLQRRVNDVARSAEAQHEAAAERVRHLSARLEEALASAEDRFAALEAEMNAPVRGLERD